MAVLEQVDPIPVFGFSVELGGEVAGWFSECSGLSVQREVKAQPEGGVNDYVHQLPGRVTGANITLKHGLAGNELWQWFQQGLYAGQVERRNVTVVLYDVDLTEVNRWDLVDAYPAKWTGGNLNTANNEVVIETLELAQGSGSPSSASTVQRAPEGEAETETVAGAAAQEIDLPALAQKVYALLKRELSVERERRGWNRSG
jgi:phage tail-like protein